MSSSGRRSSRLLESERELLLRRARAKSEPTAPKLQTISIQWLCEFRQIVGERARLGTVGSFQFA